MILHTLTYALGCILAAAVIVLPVAAMLRSIDAHVQGQDQ